MKVLENRATGRRFYARETEESMNGQTRTFRLYPAEFLVDDVSFRIVGDVPDETARRIVYERDLQNGFTTNHAPS